MSIPAVENKLNIAILKIKMSAIADVKGNNCEAKRPELFSVDRTSAEQLNVQAELWMLGPEQCLVPDVIQQRDDLLPVQRMIGLSSSRISDRSLKTRSGFSANNFAAWS